MQVEAVKRWACRATASKRKHLSINTHPLGNLDMLGLLTNINTLIINPLWISHDFDAEALGGLAQWSPFI